MRSRMGKLESLGALVCEVVVAEGAERVSDAASPLEGQEELSFSELLEIKPVLPDFGRRLLLLLLLNRRRRKRVEMPLFTWRRR